MNNLINIVLIGGGSITIILGVMLLIVCIAEGRNKKACNDSLIRTQKSIPASKPTIPTKKGDWDDIDVPMR
ncbi:MAG: hypothetical protein WBL80_05640 [Erysipelotrichaceae bacterium]